MSDVNPYVLLNSVSSVWAIEPSRLHALASTIAAGHRVGASQRPHANRSAAIVPILGPLEPRPSVLSELFGCSDYASMRQRLAEAASDSSVDQILLYVDSPGGAVQGLEEAVSDIHAAARIKPVVAFVDGLCASAAYWLASASASITATPSAQIGSIGCITIHTDISGAMEKAGVKPTIIVSDVSPHKADGHSMAALSPEAHAHTQRQVNTIGNKFVSAVARGRRVSESTVKARFGGGRMFFADEAKALGMIDGLGSHIDALGGRSGISATALEGVLSAALAPDHVRAAEARRRRLALLAH